MAKKSKISSSETLIKEQYGSFEIRLSNDKVEIEEKPSRAVKHVYRSSTAAYQLISYLLSDVKFDGVEVVDKTEAELREDGNVLNLLVTLMSYTSLLFSSDAFAMKFGELVGNYVENPPVDNTEDEESEEEILANMKAEAEAANIIKENDNEEPEGDNGLQ